MAKGSIALLCALAVSGCASVTSDAVPLNAARHAPAERIFGDPPADADSTLIVIRDIASVGWPCFWGLWVNDALVARVGVAEQVELRVRSGEVRVTTTRDPSGTGMCSSFLGRQQIDRLVTVEPGSKKVYRMYMLASGGMDIVRGEN